MSSSPELLEKVERAIVAIIGFATRWARTLCDATFAPARLRRHAAEGRLAPPNTFVAVCALCGIRGIRRAVAAILIFQALPSVCSSGRNDTLVNPKLPALASDLTLPSLSEMVMVALPLIVVLVGVTRVLPLRRREGAVPDNESVLRHASYAVGLQQIGFFAAGATIAEIVDLASHRVAFDPTAWIPSWTPDWSGYAVTFILVIGMPSRALMAGLRPMPRAHSKWRRLTGWFGRLGISMIVLGLTALITSAVAYPLAREELRRSRLPRPMLQYRPLELSAGADSVVEAAFVLTNDSYERLVMRADDLELVIRIRDDSTSPALIYNGALSTWNGNQTKLVILDSGAMGWATGRFRPDSHGRTEDSRPPTRCHEG